MPLSDPAPRRLLHLRDIELRGYERDDGLFDIEARLMDTKTYSFRNQDRGEINPGTPLHGMLARMTVDEDMLIHRFEAATEFGPVLACPAAAPNFESLAGLTDRPRLPQGGQRAGRRRSRAARICASCWGRWARWRSRRSTPVRRRKESAPNSLQNPTRPALLNSCLAYADGGEIARGRGRSIMHETLRVNVLRRRRGWPCAFGSFTPADAFSVSASACRPAANSSASASFTSRCRVDAADARGTPSQTSSTL